VGSFIWPLFDTSLFKELKLFQTFSRLDASQIHAFGMGRYLRITYPLWFQSNVVESPSPRLLLDVLKEREGLDDEWVAKTIATLEPEVGESLPEQRFLISLTDRVTLSIIGFVEIQEPLQFSNAQASLVSFLATREKDVWVPKEELVSSLYGVEHDASVNVLRNRVNTSVRDYIRNADLLDVADEENKTFTDQIELIEFKRWGNKSFWRLNSACDVAVFAELGRLYRSICDVQNQQEGASILSIEDLQIACEQNQRVYGSGFLSKHLQADAMPYWVQQQYCTHRDRWLSVLTSTIEREQKHLNELESGKKKNEAARALARHYGQRAFAEAGSVPQPLYGQHDLIRCLKVFRQLKNVGMAREICREYVNRRRAIDKTWDVSDALYDAWPDAFKRVAYRSKET
jgi:hypothetical protein